MSFPEQEKPTTLETNGPLHTQIRRKLQDRISQMTIGERLPPERNLSTLFDVDRATVRRAMADLQREGFIIRHQGRGTFVRKNLVLGAPDGSKTKLIGLVVPDVEMRSNAQILKGVEQELTFHRCEALVCNSVLDTGRERRILDWLRRQDMGGIIVCPFYGDSVDGEYADLLRRIQASGRKLVLVDQYIPDLDLSVVMTDKEHQGYLVTEHLIMLGHRRICYASTGRFDTSGRANLMGYRRAIKEYGLEYDESLVLEYPVELSATPAHDGVKRLLEKDRRAFTAVATPLFSMLYGIWRALEELGLRIPQDIAVVGGETAENPEYAHVTHTDQPFQEMGREAVRLLLREQTDNSLKRHVLLKATLIVGDTCGMQTGRT